MGFKFSAAKPVFIKGKSREVNYTAGFVCKFTVCEGKNYVLKFTGATFARVTLDGEFFHYGPARAAHGNLRCDELALPLKPGEHTVAFEVAGYNCPSFYTMRHESFLQAEILEDGEVIAYTGRDFAGVSLTSLREQRVPRYSYQRAFTEVYYLDSPLADWKNGDFAPEELEELAFDEELLPRVFRVPEFAISEPMDYRFSGKYTPRHAPYTERSRYIDSFAEGFVAFDYDSCPNDVVDAVESDFEKDETIADDLTAGQFAQYRFTRIQTGFIRTSLTVHEPSVVYVIFGEKLDGDYVFFGNVHSDSDATMNILKYKLAPGEQVLESFDPYSYQNAAVMVESGRVTVRELTLREYCYPVKPLDVKTGDEVLDRLLVTCQNAYRQNTIDAFMDCPGRERAGWLCDSYFTAQASLLFSGDISAEQGFLDNFRLAKNVLPAGRTPADVLSRRRSA